MPLVDMTVTMNEIHEEVESLRKENKLLAQQLHADKYTAKARAQEESSALKKGNEKLKNEISEMKMKMKTFTDRYEQCEIKLQQDRIKITEIVEENSTMEYEIQALEEKTRELREENKSKREVTLVEKDKLEKILFQIQTCEMRRDELNDTNKEMSSIVERREDEISDLGSELTTLEQETDLVMKEKSEIDLKILTLGKEEEDARENLTRKEKEINELKNELRKLRRVEQTGKSRINEITNKNQHLSSLNNKTKPSRSVTSQTPAFTKNQQTNSIERDIVASLQGVEVEIDDDSVTSSSSIMTSQQVRVSGVGGNAKVKLGKMIEARTTGYSRHVNLSVKLNK